MIYSRSNKKWYDGKIENIITVTDDNDHNKQVTEWLIVRYNNKKTKRIQRNCNDIKPIPNNHNVLLKKKSFCLIYSNITKLWCKGQIISIFNDKEGEWLKIKYWDTNEHKICDIQRYSKDLKVFDQKLLHQPKPEKLPPPDEPWKLLESNNEILPNKLSNLVRLNDNEYIVAPWNSFSDDMEEKEMKNNGIYKYNVNENEWRLFILYPKEFISEYQNMSIDYDQQIIYLLNDAGIWRIDIATKKFECFGLENECCGALTFIVDSKCNIFWGNNSNKHLLWNDNDTKIVYEFEELKKGMISFGIVYNSKEGYFLLFGGFKGKELGRSDEIWKYSLNGKKWEKLELTMPDKMQSFGCVITLNCKHVLIFGGTDSKGFVGGNDKIYILDLVEMEWSLSKIPCPFKGVGVGNVIITKSNNEEYVHLLQGSYRHIKAPLSHILSSVDPIDYLAVYH